MRISPRRLLSCICIASVLLPVTSFAENDSYPFVVKNHFNKKLNFTVGINPHVLKNFPASLNPSEQAQTEIIVPIEGPKEAYIRVEVDDTKNENAFWGVDIENGKAHFHGYISKNIAYSWKNDTITFCTPVEYKQNRGCKV